MNVFPARILVVEDNASHGSCVTWIRNAEKDRTAPSNARRRLDDCEACIAAYTDSLAGTAGSIVIIDVLSYGHTQVTQRRGLFFR